MAEVDVYGYLARLRLDHPGPPSVEGLHLLHRAQVERVAYENLDIQLGRVFSIDPVDSFGRVVAGRGGYCFHCNGAFGLLLSTLGYQVRWHRGGVQGRDEPGPVGATGNHLALTVHDLPSADNPAGVWFVDAGLGDALHEPLPVRPGEYRDGPFRVACVQRRDATGADVLRGRMLTRIPTGQSRELTSAAEWYAALADVFGLVVPVEDRLPLWQRVTAAHEAWLASR